jgi:hypothetical protein
LRKSLIWSSLILLGGLLLWASFRQASPAETPTATPASLDLDIPQKALWRNHVFVSARATAGTTCRLIYIPPSGDQKLMEVTASPDGMCQWKWKIEETDGKGNARLIFTIDGVSETHFIEIRSAF